MTKPPSPADTLMDSLLDIMAALRTPETGCPWDLEQDFQSISAYTIEEAYEVADAIQRDDMPDLRDELGDLLFQTVFHARMAEEKGHFDFADVVAAITDKMVRRHPHVFSTQSIATADDQTRAWEDHKARERKAKGYEGLLDDVPVGLPGMARAVKLQKRAARVGFDWTDAKDVLNKITEETTELQAAIEQGDQRDIEDEFGDLLFVLANLSRHLSVDPEAALRRTNAKFIRRFTHIEKSLTEKGKSLDDASLDEMEHYWTEAKKLEHS